MSVSEIGRPARQNALRATGDVNPVGQLRSIAELQAIWRAGAVTAAPWRGGRALLPDVDEPSATDSWAGGAVPLPAAASVDGADVLAGCLAADPPARGGVTGLPAGWVAVVAAHAGAGASTAALAICDAADGAGRPAHLVDIAPPGRSGLAAVTRSELGLDRSGCWRRGIRGQATVDRRAVDGRPSGWPDAPVRAGLSVADLGLRGAGDLHRLVAGGGHRTLVVFRATVPGVRLAEQTLALLPDIPAVAAVIGPGRWPGEVSASSGARLRALRAAGRLVVMPVDRHLERAGPSPHRLPKALRAAGRALLDQLDQLDGAARPG